MRTLRELCVRACALSAALLGAAAFAGPACSLIDAGSDCKSACETLKTCGLLSTGDCGVYCAGMVSGAVIAGCNDQFDAQNQCAKANTQCTASSAGMCATQTEAFAKCMKDYCSSHPDGQGCPQVAGDAGAGDGGP